MVQIPWTAPATFTDGAVLTAAQLNAIRDNLNETAPAKSSSAGGFIVTTGLNSIIQRTPAMVQIDTVEGTTSTAFADLPGIGPVVTVATGAKAFVTVAALMIKDVTNTAGLTSYAVSGASTIAATDGRSARVDGLPAGQGMRVGVSILDTSLAAGTNTFTQKYKVSSGLGTFGQRHLVVMPF